MNLRERLKTMGASGVKLKALLDMGVSDALVEQLLADIALTEKAADLAGVRYKAVSVEPNVYAALSGTGASMKPSQEARVLERAIEAAGWSVDGADSAPLWDEWQAHGLQSALALAVRCKEAKITPQVYAAAHDPWQSPNYSDRRPR